MWDGAQEGLDCSGGSAGPWLGSCPVGGYEGAIGVCGEGSPQRVNLSPQPPTVPPESPQEMGQKGRLAGRSPAMFPAVAVSRRVETTRTCSCFANCRLFVGRLWGGLSPQWGSCGLRWRVQGAVLRLTDLEGKHT